MIQPTPLVSRPSFVLTLLGGMVGAILTSALLQLGPLVTPEFPDLPRLIGGLFTGDATMAFWLGFWLFFLGGVLVIAPLVGAVWSSLPGGDIGFGGAALKGVVTGVVLWIVWGLLLPVLGALDVFAGPGLDPGLFGVRAGLGATAGLLVSQLGYGLAVTLIAAMGRGIHPLDTIGTQGYGFAWVREVTPRRP